MLPTLPAFTDIISPLESHIQTAAALRSGEQQPRGENPSLWSGTIDMNTSAASSVGKSCSLGTIPLCCARWCVLLLLGHPGVFPPYPESMSFSLVCSCEGIAWGSTCIKHLLQRSRLAAEKKRSLRPVIGQRWAHSYNVDRTRLKESNRNCEKVKSCKSFVQLTDNSHFACGLHRSNSKRKEGDSSSCLQHFLQFNELLLPFNITCIILNSFFSIITRRVCLCVCVWKKCW